MLDDDARLTLEGLQRRLDALEIGAKLTITLQAYRRLFGVNDVARERARHFAAGHGCRLALAGDLVAFHKVGEGVLRTQPTD